MSKKIVIVNQHGDNRGDESATIGIVKEVYRLFGSDTNITMYRQDRCERFLEEKYGVIEKTMSRNPLFYLLGLFCKGKNAGNKELKEYICDLQHADLILSACGGPYVGDIYWKHEFLHLIYLLIPIKMQKKVYFAAPSMGPFHNKISNIFRKKILKNARLIIVRDHISKEYLRELLDDKLYESKVIEASDACFADQLEFDEEPVKSNTIGITPIMYKYRNKSERKAKQASFRKTIIDFLDEEMEKDKNLQVEFFPQLYNNHSDMGVINQILENLKYRERAIVFSDKLSGREQQKEIASMKYMICARYHSAVFSCKVKTPCISIAYEHKAVGMMTAMGLSDYVLDINDFDLVKLQDMKNKIEKNREQILEIMNNNLPIISQNAHSIIELIHEDYLLN